MDRSRPYTCNDYRQEMILISLRRQLQREDLSADEKENLRNKIHQLELEMGML